MSALGPLGPLVFLSDLCYNESHYIFREVFENMVAEGVIIPKPDEAPPTVPMDYNWARVITAHSLYNTPCYYTDLDITWSCCGSPIFLP